MRIITTAIIAIMVTASAAFATSLYIGNDDRLVEYKELPTDAKSFIESHFKGEEILHIIHDRDIVGGDYTVSFASGIEVEFNNSGDWTDIDCGKRSVPQALIPQQIADYVAAKHPNSTITEIKREHGHTEVKLNGGLELTFNSRYRIVDVDD